MNLLLLTETKAEPLDLQEGAGSILEVTDSQAHALVFFEAAAIAELNLPVWSIGPQASETKLSRKTLIGILVAGAILLTGIGGFGAQAFLRQIAVNEIAEAGLSPDAGGLQGAVVQGKLALLPVFSRIGVDLRKTPRIIEAAIESGSAETLVEVLKAGASLENEPNRKLLLHSAVASDNERLVAAAIALGLSKDPELPVNEIVHLAVNERKWKALAAIAKEEPFSKFVDTMGNTLVHFVTLADAPEVIQGLRANAKIDLSVRNKLGQTPLHFALAAGASKAANELVAAGLDPLAQDAEGLTPASMALTDGKDEFLAALAGNHKGVVDYLLTRDLSPVFERGMSLTGRVLVERGLSINQQFATGLTPLAAAAVAPDVTNLQLLLEKGADPNISTSLSGVTGVTPLMIAAAAGNEKAVLALLAKGALPATVASNGATAKAIALGKGNLSIAELLN